MQKDRYHILYSKSPVFLCLQTLTIPDLLLTNSLGLLQEVIASFSSMHSCQYCSSYLRYFYYPYFNTLTYTHTHTHTRIYIYIYIQGTDNIFRTLWKKYFKVVTSAKNISDFKYVVEEWKSTTSVIIFFSLALIILFFCDFCENLRDTIFRTWQKILFY